MRRGSVCAVTRECEDCLFGHWCIRGECVFSHSCPPTIANCDAASVCFVRRSCGRSTIASRECVCSHRWTRNDCVSSHWCLRTVANCVEAQACFDRRSCERSGTASRECMLSHQNTRGIVVLRLRLPSKALRRTSAPPNAARQPRRCGRRKRTGRQHELARGNGRAAASGLWKEPTARPRRPRFAEKIAPRLGPRQRCQLHS